MGRIAPGGRRGTFAKGLITALGALGIFLYIPFTSKASLPFALNKLKTNTLSSSISSTIPDDMQIENKPSYLKYWAAATVAKETIDSRCWATRGSWCQTWLTNLQHPIPATSPPKYNKTCLWDCNGVGVCDAFTGLCRCPAGWDGDACDIRMRRPCSAHHRSSGFEPYESNSIDWNDPDIATLRCSGQCDDDIGMCYCNSTSKYGRIPAEVTDPPKTPPRQVGRPLGESCQLNFHPSGLSSAFGDKDPEDIYGVDGWCQADSKPRILCDCFLDGLLGDLCEIPVEHFCANQCSGHGQCYLGWCQCHKGYYGHDCAYRVPGVAWDNGLTDGHASFGAAVPQRYWLADVASTPAAHDVVEEREDSGGRHTAIHTKVNKFKEDSIPTKKTANRLNRRPLIYVYELHSKFNQLMLQYRFQRYSCTHRLFEENNMTRFLDGWHYQAETGLHEMLLQSKHRTLDPEKADFFYMPVYVSCFYWPVYGAADFPWFHGGPTSTRVSQGVNLLLEMWTWVQSHKPYWDRSNGRDHILLVTHDEGSCHVPAVLRNATILTHWGRKDLNHTSGSAYDSDVYSKEVIHPVYQPEGHLHKLGSYPCYDPKKDLVIPPMYSPLKYYFSPLHGAPEQHNRSILAFFKGDLRLEDTRMIYSRGLRQNLTSLRLKHRWWSKYRIWIGQRMPTDDKEIKKLAYGEALSSSVFCFVLPGDGWSGRFEDAIMHGCIPVIIQDEVDVSFESLFDVNEFSLRIAQKDIDQIPEILQGISSERIQQMQNGVKQMMKRYSYGSYGPHAVFSQLIREDWISQANENAVEKNNEQRIKARFLEQRSHASGDKIKAEVEEATAGVQDDAFETILAFLTAKMKQWDS
ncbi:hypothetical protein Ndes2526A_g07692 [Nannochloris sp. 'desiccata']|nr:hypothetical protein KSW81_002452 [Chlorella desiccata (nom. nud.)]